PEKVVRDPAWKIFLARACRNSDSGLRSGGDGFIGIAKHPCVFAFSSKVHGYHEGGVLSRHACQATRQGGKAVPIPCSVDAEDGVTWNDAVIAVNRQRGKSDAFLGDSVIGLRFDLTDQTVQS